MEKVFYVKICKMLNNNHNNFVRAYVYKFGWMCVCTLASSLNVIFFFLFSFFYTRVFMSKLHQDRQHNEHKHKENCFGDVVFAHDSVELVDKYIKKSGSLNYTRCLFVYMYIFHHIVEIVNCINNEITLIIAQYRVSYVVG